MATVAAQIPIRTSDVEDDCGECARRLTAELEGHRGLVAVEPAGTSTIKVSFDPDVCSLSCVTDAADRIGADLLRRFHHEVVPVRGMDCYDCASTIERALSRIDGVTACAVNFPAAQMRVEYESRDDDERQKIADRVRKQMKSLGYAIPALAKAGPGLVAVSLHEAEHDHEASFVVRRRHELLTGVSAVLLVAGAVVSLLGFDLAGNALFAISVIVGGAMVARSGMAAVIATRRPDINSLLVVAVVGAVAIGAWLEAALVVVLFSVGESLEHYAMERSRRSLLTLLTLAPDTATVVSSAGERECPASELAVGDVVVVRPGQQIPGDGVVVEGASAVDQAAITGESVPVDKVAGDDAFAGTLNGEGRLLLRITCAPGDTTLARVGKAIAEAQAQKAPAERWVDAFARVYTPIVMAVALVTATVPPLLGFGSYSDWIYRGLAFLILACPCALVIATPVSIVAALARASSAGVLIKGGAFLEAAAKVQAFAFDKTGTLTAGHPRVTKVVSLDSVPESRVLQLAASLEVASEHPLAGAIVAEARSRNLELLGVEAFVSTRGNGIEGIVAGRSIRVGRPAAFADHPESARLDGPTERFMREGRTLVVVGSDAEITGLIALNDVARPNARDALDELRALGMRHQIMLTGDHEAAGRAVARAAGADEVRANLLPEQKVEAVAEIEAEYGPTAMVGDGVNDAPALARSSLGIAMGTAGSPTAIENADIALMGDDLTKLPRLVGLARWSQVVVRQNISFSLAVKAVAAVLALVGLLTLWMAVLADVGATLVVVANGLRLLRGGPRAGSLSRVPMLVPRGTGA